MKMMFRLPNLNDLDQIMAIENQGFSIDEAATREAMIERIQKIADSFILVESKEKILGYVVGPVISERYLYDELFEETVPNPKSGGYQSILSLVVASDYRNQGLASQLLKQLEKLSQKNQRQGITLTCLEDLIPFYEQNGYQNEGISTSQHANEIWFNLVKEFY